MTVMGTLQASVRRSDWLANPQTTLVAIITLGIPSQSFKYMVESFITSACLASHPCMGHWSKTVAMTCTIFIGQVLADSIIVMLCIHFLTFLKWICWGSGIVGEKGDNL